MGSKGPVAESRRLLRPLIVPCEKHVVLQIETKVLSVRQCCIAYGRRCTGQPTWRFDFRRFGKLHMELRSSVTSSVPHGTLGGEPLCKRRARTRVWRMPGAAELRWDSCAFLSFLAQASNLRLVCTLLQLTCRRIGWQMSPPTSRSNCYSRHTRC